ncbi:MAG: hypothetical protein N4A53_09120 [Pelagimonas sp.]|jgi:hypothetical protein|nr:hypothetical protein [Pelagimonas sp.]
MKKTILAASIVAFSAATAFAEGKYGDAGTQDSDPGVQEDKDGNPYWLAAGASSSAGGGAAVSAAIAAIAVSAAVLSDSDSSSASTSTTGAPTDN